MQKNTQTHIESLAVVCKHKEKCYFCTTASHQAPLQSKYRSEQLHILPIFTFEFTGNKDNNIKHHSSGFIPHSLTFKMCEFMNVCACVCVCATCRCSSLHTFSIIYIVFNAITAAAAACCKFPSFLSFSHKLCPPLLICPTTQSPFIMIALP